MEPNSGNEREPAILGRLLIRSALLGALVPVGTQAAFWSVKLPQSVSGLVLGLVLYGLEKAVLFPFRKRLSIRPLHLAAYRGSLLYSLLIFAESADWAQALGAAIGGALAALLLFEAENRIIRLLAKNSSA